MNPSALYAVLPGTIVRLDLPGSSVRGEFRAVGARGVLLIPEGSDKAALYTWARIMSWSRA